MSEFSKLGLLNLPINELYHTTLPSLLCLFERASIITIFRVAEWIWNHLMTN